MDSIKKTSKNQNIKKKKLESYEILLSALQNKHINKEIKKEEN